jgi:signal transduction histidine kinase
MTEDLRAASSRVPRLVDLASVVPVLAIVILGTIHIPVESGDRPMDALAYLCGIVGAVSLVFWRRSAVAVVGVVLLTTAIYSARDYAGGPALLPGPLALLALGYTAPRRVGWIGAASYVVVTILARVTMGNAAIGQLLIIVGWASAAVLAGQALAARGERAAAQHQREAHEAEQALANERLRIARDLHDSVAHAMSTINVQSGVAAHLLDSDPTQVKGALEAIRAASSDALDELTVILSAMREADGPVPLSPLPSLADVGELIERANGDGLSVTATVHGDIVGVASTVSTAAFRVVQEGLTNARRHAGPGARTEVAIDVGDRGALSVRVSDDGGKRPIPTVRHTDASSGGFGLLGMRERVESTGGTLDARTRPEGGFEVVANWSGRS